MTFRKLILTATIAAAPVLLAGQGQTQGQASGQAQGGLDPATIGKPLADSWPTYSGDYTGRRYSSLTQVNQTTVKNLTLAWVGRVNAGPPAAAGGGGFGGFGGGRGGGGGAPVIIGGEGPDDVGGRRRRRPSKGPCCRSTACSTSCAPDNVWALDARDGHELWHYFWKTKGSTHIGCRGVGMWHNNIYVETPDDYLVSLDARTGKENWHVELAELRRAVLLDDGADRRRQPRDRRHRQRSRHAGLPPVVRSGDRQAPVEVLYGADEGGRPRPRHMAESRAPRSTAAGRRGFPARTTRRPISISSARATRRPATPASDARGTTSSRARSSRSNVDTGKMKWYFQTSPHDTHDWDSAQTPVLDRRDDQRPAAQARVHRRAQRLLLHASIASPASTS